MTRTRTSRWLAVVASAGIVMVAFQVSPAAAHASGEVPRAVLSADGNEVHIELLAPPDDAAVIGTSLGILRDGAMAALLGGPSDDLPTDHEVARLSRSAELADYLRSNVVVRQDGHACSAQAYPAADFLRDGARLEFHCPAPVVHADIRITILHDEDPAYRIFSVDGSARYAIHSAAAPEHRWDFTRAPTGMRVGDAGLVVGALAVIGAFGLAFAFAVPRRRARVDR